MRVACMFAAEQGPSNQGAAAGTPHLNTEPQRSEVSNNNQPIDASLHLTQDLMHLVSYPAASSSCCVSAVQVQAARLLRVFPRKYSDSTLGKRQLQSSTESALGLTGCCTVALTLSIVYWVWRFGNLGKGTLISPRIAG